MNTHKLPTYFISHGGGPWPWLKKEMPFFDNLEKSLQEIPRKLGQKPKAILMISGHWEAPDVTIMASSHPSMLYDYQGFPEHTYHIRYPAAGDPLLATRVQTLLADAGFPALYDTKRGFDHGAFVPAFAMYPNADIPMIQLSLHSNYDPETHINVGRALAPLRDEGVLIIGSGLSYHNLRDLMTHNPKAELASYEFDTWLQDTLLHSSHTERIQKLCHWTDAPSARAAHPEEDHLLPLMVAIGAAENDQANMIYHENGFMGQVTASSFRFGG